MNKTLLCLFTVTCVFFSCSNTPGKTNNATIKSNVNKTNVEEKAGSEDPEHYAQTQNQTGVNIHSSDNSVDNSAIKNLLSRLDKEPQIFTFDAGEGMLIKCTEGTKIRIEKNSLVDELTGQPATGNIIFSVKEYYKPADIIIAQLSTSSGGNLLETGGMLYLEASQDGRKLKLADRKTIDISFNGNESKEGMQLYDGIQNGNIIEWKLQNNNSNNLLMFDPASFPGGKVNYDLYLKQNSKAAFKGLDIPEVRKKINYTFKVDTAGKISNVANGSQGLPPLITAGKRLLENMPNWTPKRVKGKKVESEQTTLISFTKEGIASSTGYSELRNVQRDSFIDHYVAPNLKQRDKLISVIQSNKIGWVNCDKLTRVKNAINYVIAARKNCYNYLVFHKIRSLLETNRQNYFGSIPSGVDVTIISFEVNGEKIYLASKKAVTQNTIVESLDYVQVDESHFREELEKRLKF